MTLALTTLRRPTAFVLALFCLLAGCDSGAADEDRCEAFDTCSVKNELELRLIEKESRLPANVSLLFKVDTEEGKPLAHLRPGNFEIYENERLISHFESQQRILSKSGRFQYSIALLLDLSGSIVGSQSLDRLKQAARSFVEAVMFARDDPRYGEIEMGVWFFDGRAGIDSLVAYRVDPQVLLQGIDRIGAGLTQDNSTNLYGAVVQGVDLSQRRLAATRNRDVITAGSVVLFTDGTDQAGRTSRASALKAVRSADAAISVYTIGLGGEIDVPTLREIGVDGFVSAGNLDDLVARFQELAGLVRDEANSYYLLEYCSPKRAGDNDLAIKVRDGEYVGLLEARFSAKNFTAGCTVGEGGSL